MKVCIWTWIPIFEMASDFESKVLKKDWMAVVPYDLYENQK